jgi:molybdate transport system substrate-binding protein
MRILPRRRSFLSLAAAAAVLLSGAAAPAQDKGVLVFAAASLKNALEEIAGGWKAATGKSVTFSFAASPALAKQIENGAPADLFVSADLDWMDYLQQRKLIREQTRFNLVGNRIVLIAPADSKAQLKIAPGFNLAGALGDGRLAMANTDSVPAGKYGKAALEKLGAWEGVKNRIAQAADVRAALLLVARGEAPFGVVYSTDAAAEPKVRIVDAFPEATHPPILYPVALTAASASQDAQAFLRHLAADSVKPIYAKYGFARAD